MEGAAVVITEAAAGTGVIATRVATAEEARMATGVMAGAEELPDLRFRVDRVAEDILPAEDPADQMVDGEAQD